MKNSHIDDTNHYFKLAFDYVMNTSCPIYLTGKAGTGKTTFLKYVKQHCTKNMIVVAPTGVAAINAGGVTMHSFFQLPFGPYVADAPRGFGLNENMVDKNALLGKLKLGGNKRTLIQELELLVIDEVSMLRSDMLDAIDTILRMVRKRNKPFGGVQVLFIGDLYQLPPVVKETEATIFKTYYQSPFFFHAKVFEQTQPIFIELKKIYRQNEQQFIDILNNLRNNDLSEQDFDILNSRYNPTFTPKDHKYITLTSHNHKADAINHQELEKLKSTVYEYHGEIKGEFNDKQLPTDLLLKLKEGAQVMFIKNDSSGLGRYYNGKIAIIDKIDKNEIIVRFPDSNDIMTIEKETWENITYRHDDEKNNIEEKVLGTYTQFPLRLAWAITIHKSQGLTFTHAIIDAGSSFAPGQVYVALSRCTSLEGIVLQSRILPNAIHSDYRIYDFNAIEQPLHQLEKQLEDEKRLFENEKIHSLFVWKNMVDWAYLLYEKTLNTKLIPEAFNAVAFCNAQIEQAKALQSIAEKFTLELDSLFNEMAFHQEKGKIKIRLQKALIYFMTHLYDDLIMPLQQYTKQFEGVARIKKYATLLEDTENLYWQKIAHLQNATFDGKKLVEEQIIYREKTKTSPVKPKKKEKGESAKESFVYFSAGKTVEEIAGIRHLATSTIESHLATYVLSGELDVTLFLQHNEISEVKKIYDTLEYYSTTVIVQQLKNKLNHSQVKMALNHLLYLNEIKMKPVQNLGVK